MEVTEDVSNIPKLPISMKPPKFMRIKNRGASEIVPCEIGVDPGQPVEIRADDDCVVMFESGVGLLLKQNHSQLLVFPEKQTHYYFHVEYLEVDIAKPILPAIPPSTNAIETLTVYTALSTKSGPTGDIHVP